MNIFNKKKASVINDTPEGATYDQVIDFLVAVNDKDYSKIIRVADIYRAAHVDVAKATGVKAYPVPSIFERQDMPVIPANGLIGGPDGNIFLDDGEVMTTYLDDNDSPASRKQRQVAEKSRKFNSKKVEVKNG